MNISQSENLCTEIRFGKITAKALDVNGETIIDVRRTGPKTLIFMGFVGKGKWPLFMQILQKLGDRLAQAGWLGD